MTLQSCHHPVMTDDWRIKINSNAAAKLVFPEPGSPVKRRSVADDMRKS
jgi:hypothetical protein